MSKTRILRTSFHACCQKEVYSSGDICFRLLFTLLPSTTRFVIRAQRYYFLPKYANPVPFLTHSITHLYIVRLLLVPYLTLTTAPKRCSFCLANRFFWSVNCLCEKVFHKIICLYQKKVVSLHIYFVMQAHSTFFSCPDSTQQAII